MILTPRINEAIKLASRLHRDQVRKDISRTPYISHLIAVALLISSVTDDEDTIIAGLMHDSLEDVKGYTYEKLVADCGVRVADIVRHVTEPLDPNKLPDEQMPWLERQKIYLQNLREGGIESAYVSMSDKIHNTESLFSGFDEEGPEFMKRFSASLKNKVWFQESVLEIVREKVEPTNKLLERLIQETEKLKELTLKYERGV